MPRAPSSHVLPADPLPPGVSYELEGAPLRVEAGRNLTLVGGGDGATITRGLSSGRLMEVVGARLELRNLRLEGGQAQVCQRPSLRPRVLRLSARRCARPPKRPKWHVTPCARAAGGWRRPRARSQRCLGHQKLRHCPLPRRSFCRCGVSAHAPLALPACAAVHWKWILYEECGRAGAGGGGGWQCARKHTQHHTSAVWRRSARGWTRRTGCGHD